jgi:gas vesicle protein
MIQNRVNQFKDAVEQFRNQMQQRRGQVDDEIDEFQGDPNKRP